MTKEEKNSNRSPPKAANLSQTTPKKKLKTDTEKAKEKSAQLRFGKAEITPEEASRMSKAQKRELYASAAARSAVHRPVEQYEEDNVGTQALNEGSEAAENLHTAAKHRYTQKLKKAGSGPGKQSNKRTIPTKKVLAPNRPLPKVSCLRPTGSPDGSKSRISSRAIMLPVPESLLRQARQGLPHRRFRRMLSKTSSKKENPSSPLPQTASLTLHRTTPTFL